VPGYESIYMSIEDNENKEILNAYTMNFLNTLVVSDKWFSSYNLELRQDNARLNSSTGDNNSNAFKTKIGIGNIFFVTKEKNKIMTSDLAYNLNAAKGDNVKNTRTDNAVRYITP